MLAIREMDPEDVEAAVELVLDVFGEFVRPDLGDEGWASLLDYINVEAARGRNEVDHKTFLAEVEGELAGLIEIRMAKHVSLLVVRKERFGKGIARALLRKGLAFCRSENPELESLTVHSSRFAVDAYRRLGFEPVGEETVVDGIRFTPMAYRIDREK